MQRESAGKEITVTYNMETNKKVEGKTSGIIDNIVTLKADNTLTPSNKVRTTLLYKKLMSLLVELRAKNCHNLLRI